jgi:hypothetical protein
VNGVTAFCDPVLEVALHANPNLHTLRVYLYISLSVCVLGLVFDVICDVCNMWYVCVSGLMLSAVGHERF